MNGPVDRRGDCEKERSDLAEVALGIASGRRRAEVLEHVEGCARCARELDELTKVGDTLLSFGPRNESPIGFELRLAQRLRNDAIGPRPSRAHRAGVWALAAVLIAVVGLGVGSLVRNHQPSPVSASSPALRVAALKAGGRGVGELMVSAGRPAWMFMTLEDASWSGLVTCEVVFADGHVETTGRFKLSGGYGAWGAPLRAPAGDVRKVRLITQSGSVYASAQLPA